MIDHLHALAVHAYYAGEHETGRRACDRLLNQPLPEAMERQARANRTWYTPLLGQLAPVAFHPFSVEPARPGWSLFNPSILSVGPGYLAVVRSSNYRIEAGRYVIPPEDGDAIRTINLLAVLGPDFDVLSCREITEPDYARNGYPVHGWEDCRLRETPAGIGVSATVRDAAGWDGRCRIATAALDADTATLSGMRVMEWEGLQPHEKNWMPIDGVDGWLYGCGHDGHTVTVQADAELPGCYGVARHHPAPHIARGFRGSSQLVRLRDGWLAVVHETAVMDTGLRAYEHRFVWFDSGFRLARMSPLFSFREQRAIEFSAGLAIKDGTVVVTFGVRDAEAWIATLSEEDVCGLLASVS